jgi:membrane protein involved in colicin uptake
LEAQIAALLSLDEQIISVEQAQRELDQAQARRDQIMTEVNQNGFAELIRVSQQTGVEMARAAMTAAQVAGAAVARAEASLAAATAATATATTAVAVATNANNNAATAAAAAAAAATQAAAAAAAAAEVAAATVAPAMGVAPDWTNANAYMGGGGGGVEPFNRNINAFANGGMHSGGLRIVGENGPELEATGPSRIYNANQLGNMMGGGDTANEVKALREEMRLAMFQIAKNTGKSYDLLDRWNGDGLPPERIV